MNTTLPSLRTDILNSLSPWRTMKQGPLTPPMTSTFETRSASQSHHQQQVRMTLPPIAHLERQLSSRQPLTPPDDVPSYSQQSTSRLPPIIDTHMEDAPFQSTSQLQQSSHQSSSKPTTTTTDFFHQSKPSIPADAPHLVDWLDFSRTRSAHFIAEKTCEMICYLWFSGPPSSSSSHSGAGTTSAEQAYASPTNSPPFPRSSSSLPSSTPFASSLSTSLQLSATPTFIQFMQKLLETTQVSQSVIVLSLHYIYRLKERNRFTPAQSGSEFRIAVAGLMMANKFLDDNTYTNKTWSEVSGISLDEINRMEREFLLGVDFNLYVDKSTYESWLNLLKGLVMAKERDSRQYWCDRRGGYGGAARRASRTGRVMPAQNHGSVGPSVRSYMRDARRESYRARSTSPTSRSYASYQPTSSYTNISLSTTTQQAAPSYHPMPIDTTYSPTPTPRSGSKRSAAAAFSPTSASFSVVPHKRAGVSPQALRVSPQAVYVHSQRTSPSSRRVSPIQAYSQRVSPVQSRRVSPVQRAQRPGITLHIPEVPNPGPHSHSPLESLQSFAKMSLASSGSSPARVGAGGNGGRGIVPETLVTPYALDEERRGAIPQNLYFYALACSPMESEEENRSRKARLRSYQPPAPAPSYQYNYSTFPSQSTSSTSTTSTSSANSTSAINASTNAPAAYIPYTFSAPSYRPVAVQSASTSPMHVGGGMGMGYGGALPHFHDNVWARPPMAAQPQQVHVPAQEEIAAESEDEEEEEEMRDVQDASPAVPSAPFANAGPPGVHFYPTPMQSSVSVPGFGYRQACYVPQQQLQQREYQHAGPQERVYADEGVFSDERTRHYGHHQQQNDNWSTRRRC
ncbi:cyclin-domain-containing protein [Crucibulum laeve]|uniref:Cyclin-domain-containing protein n=1 Tax=Crucibulum laeve TaxID=68775 RepID=A0A5C3M0V6_9AGAR|nr:cyclin-domain-containing protein [Crucibulum laeve]